MNILKKCNMIKIINVVYVMNHLIKINIIRLNIKIIYKNKKVNYINLFK